jgi:hypothetical protein
MMLTEKQALDKCEELADLQLKMSQAIGMASSQRSIMLLVLPIMVKLFMAMTGLIIYLVGENIKIQAALRSRGSKI